MTTRTGFDTLMAAMDLKQSDLLHAQTVHGLTEQLRVYLMSDAGALMDTVAKVHAMIEGRSPALLLFTIHIWHLSVLAAMKPMDGATAIDQACAALASEFADLSMPLRRS